MMKFLADESRKSHIIFWLIVILVALTNRGIAYNSLNLLITEDAIKACLDDCSRYLRQGGKLLRRGIACPAERRVLTKVHRHCSRTRILWERRACGVAANHTYCEGLPRQCVYEQLCALVAQVRVRPGVVAG